MLGRSSLSLLWSQIHGVMRWKGPQREGELLPMINFTVIDLNFQVGFVVVLGFTGG